MRRHLRPSKRFAILKRDGFRCKYCGASGDGVELHVDHVVPVSRGGTDHPGNLVAACRSCNMGKGNDAVVWAPCTPLVDVNGDPAICEDEFKSFPDQPYLQPATTFYEHFVFSDWHDDQRARGLTPQRPECSAICKIIRRRSEALFGEDGLGVERCRPCQ